MAKVNFWKNDMYEERKIDYQLDWDVGKIQSWLGNWTNRLGKVNAYWDYPW
jgi:hypothetical protein